MSLRKTIYWIYKTPLENFYHGYQKAVPHYAKVKPYDPAWRSIQIEDCTNYTIRRIIGYNTNSGLKTYLSLKEKNPWNKLCQLWLLIQGQAYHSHALSNIIDHNKTHLFYPGQCFRYSPHISFETISAEPMIPTHHFKVSDTLILRTSALSHTSTAVRYATVLLIKAASFSPSVVDYKKPFQNQQWTE